MRATIGLCIALYVATPCAQARAQAAVPRGFFAVPVVSQQAISSAGAYLGEVVLFSTKIEFTWLNESFPSGSIVSGVVVQCRSAHGLGRDGIIDIALSGIQLPDGHVLPINGSVVVQGNGDHGRKTLGIPSGREAVLPAGTEVIGVLSTDPKSQYAPH